MKATEEIKLFDAQEDLSEGREEVTLVAPAQFLTVRAGGDNW